MLSKQLCNGKKSTEKGGRSVGLLMVLPAGRQCVNLACTNLLSIDNLCFLTVLQGSSGTTTIQLPLFLERYGHSQQYTCSVSYRQAITKENEHVWPYHCPFITQHAATHQSQESLKYLQ
uniref:Uncharacterized protein n=1 Tax=Rhipicephalus appendiculatus TaxID=34631 RepID=A0A131YEM9_RHIAP